MQDMQNMLQVSMIGIPFQNQLLGSSGSSISNNDGSSGSSGSSGNSGNSGNSGKSGNSGSQTDWNNPTLLNNPNAGKFTTYCENVLVYMATCIEGPQIADYCSTKGLYCVDNSGPYNLNNVVVQCNATTVTLCPERYYCPNPYTMIGCPKGHYCREGVVRPRPCVFLTAACPIEMMANPSTYTTTSILLVMFVVFIVSYEFFMHRRVKSEERHFKEATNYKTIQTLEQEAISPIAGVAVTRGNYMPQPIYNPPTSPDSDGSMNSVDSGSMVISRLNGSNWVKIGLESRELERRRRKEESENKSSSIQDEGTVQSEVTQLSAAEKVFQAVHRSFRMAQEHMLPMGEMGLSKENLASGKIATISSFQFNKVKDSIDVDFCELYLTLKSNDQSILTNVCGSFKAGHITAIIGPSGAGKTSLLSLLRGQTHYASINGVIRVNRVPVLSLQNYRDRVAYVPQEDILYDDLTVEENVMYSALLFNRRGLTKSIELYGMVNHALELLGIKFICNSVVGSVDKKGISGGQRRRVSVAMEMMKESDMFLLDEPTSGLDSGTSISLMNCLHSLAALGTNVVATLHQPRNEIFNLADWLLLLAPGGRIVYSGHPGALAGHFHNLSFTCPRKTNVADFVMDVMSGFVCMRGQETLHPVEVILAYLCEWWEESQYPEFKQLFLLPEPTKITQQSVRLISESFRSTDPLKPSKTKRPPSNYFPGNVLENLQRNLSFSPEVEPSAKLTEECSLNYESNFYPNQNNSVTSKNHNNYYLNHVASKNNNNHGSSPNNNYNYYNNNVDQKYNKNKNNYPSTSTNNNNSPISPLAPGQNNEVMNVMILEQQNSTHITSLASQNPTQYPVFPSQNSAFSGVASVHASANTSGRFSAPNAAPNSRHNSNASSNMSDTTPSPLPAESVDNQGSNRDNNQFNKQFQSFHSRAQNEKMVKTENGRFVEINDVVEKGGKGEDVEKKGLGDSDLEVGNSIPNISKLTQGMPKKDFAWPAQRYAQSRTRYSPYVEKDEKETDTKEKNVGKDAGIEKENLIVNNDVKIEVGCIDADTVITNLNTSNRCSSITDINDADTNTENEGRGCYGCILYLRNRIAKRYKRNKSTFFVALTRQFRVFNRSIGSLKSDCSILFVLGAIIALLFGTVQISRYTGGGFAGQVSSMQLAFGLLIMSSSLRLFGSDCTIRKREEDGGIYIIPYYLGKLSGQSLELVVAPLAFLFGYYALATPGGSFFDYWLFTLLLYLTVMGMANLVSVVVPGKGKGLIANGLIVILWSFGGLSPTSASLRQRLGLFGISLNAISPFKYTFEFQMLAEFVSYSNAYDIQIDKYLLQFEYSRDDYVKCIMWLLFHALCSNLLAILWLLWAKDHFRLWRMGTFWIGDIKRLVTGKKRKVSKVGI